MLMKTVIAFGTAASLLGLSALTSPIGAQTSTSPPAAADGQSGQGTQSGTTSGPASGSPSTLGTTGTTSGTPHQLDVIKDQSSGVQREIEQSGQSGTTQGTGSVGTGQPGHPGTEAGPPPTKSPTQ